MQDKFANGEAFPVLPIKDFGELSVDAVGVETSAFTEGGPVRITSDADMFVLITSGTKIGTADGDNGHRLRSTDTLDVMVGDNEKITAICASGTGTLYWTKFGY